MVYIQLSDIRDIRFADVAQEARVDGATLPSGLSIPISPGKMWIIRGDCIHCEELPEVENPESENENE